MWAHQSMDAHLPPLRESTTMIQVWKMVWACFSWIVVTWSGWWAHRWGRATPVCGSTSTICLDLHSPAWKILKYKWNLLFIKICSWHAYLPLIQGCWWWFWVRKSVTFSPSTLCSTDLLGFFTCHRLGFIVFASWTPILISMLIKHPLVSSFRCSSTSSRSKSVQVRLCILLNYKINTCKHISLTWSCWSSNTKIQTKWTKIHCPYNLPYSLATPDAMAMDGEAPPSASTIALVRSLLPTTPSAIQYNLHVLDVQRWLPNIPPPTAGNQPAQRAKPRMQGHKGKNIFSGAKYM
jgi:hypothetical protein